MDSAQRQRQSCEKQVIDQCRVGRIDSELKAGYAFAISQMQRDQKHYRKGRARDRWAGKNDIRKPIDEKWAKVYSEFAGERRSPIGM